MVLCWAPGCKHYNQKEKCKCFKFPKSLQERNKWKTLVRRHGEPGPGAFLCSCHFPDGKRENGPQLFDYNKEKRFQFSTPEKRKRFPKKEKSSISEDESEKVDTVPRLSFDMIKGNDELVLLYTGLPNATIFESVFELVKYLKINYYLQWKVEKINRQDQLLLTLMKLRQNFPHVDLAQRFGISQAAVTNIIITWVHVLHKVLFVRLMSKIPSRKHNRTCLSIFTAVPRQSMLAQRSTYSSYKHRNTWKGLIGVAPNGVITFVSNLFPGSTSDKKVVQNCGILKQLEVGDLILADKGFLIRDILPPGVALNIPPFLTCGQFTPEQVRQTECIVRARIHVERAIRRIKVFRILNFIPNKLVPYADEVFQTVAALTNLQYPLIKKVEQYFSAEME